MFWSAEAAETCQGSDLLVVQLVVDLIRLANQQQTGPWHTLPDLLTCLSTDQFKGNTAQHQRGQAKHQAGFIQGLAIKAGQALLGGMGQAVQSTATSLARGHVEQLLIAACTSPSDPLLVMPDGSRMGPVAWDALIFK